MGTEDIRCEQLEQTPRDVEFRAQVVICCSLRQLGCGVRAGESQTFVLGRQAQIGSQGVVDNVLGAARSLEDFLYFWGR